MARRSILAAAIDRCDPEQETSPIERPREVTATRRNPNIGKYHLGGYFASDDPTAEAFRVFAAKTRRSHQELLAEAIGDLVAKYEAAAHFKQ